jgi:hypothetical protein
MALEGFRVRPTEDGDKVTVLAEDDDVRVITTIPRGVVDDVSPSKLATVKNVTTSSRGTWTGLAE